jgi:diguanylate cyclase (GGDEF)-like protein
MEQPHAATYRRSKPCRTLLVEPNERLRQVIELELSVREHSTVSRPDAQQGLSAFKDDTFDLVIVSLALPDGDTPWLCREIRALPGGDDVAIVVASDREHGTDRNSYVYAGADDIITWPALDEPFSSHLDIIEQIRSNREQSANGQVDGSSERFLVINPNGTIRKGAPIAERLLGFPSAAIVGVNAFSFFHPDDAPQLLSIVTEAFSCPDQTRPIEARVRLDGDSWRTITISAENRTADPGIRGIVFNLRGPDAHVGADDQVTRTVMHDRVTDLPNRNLFDDRVDHAIARAGRSRNAVVVLAIDFSGFTSHDDTDRPDVDDGLILAIAQRLRSCLRSGDTAARIGIDQFGVLLEDIAATEHVDIVADRIIHAMSVPFVGNGTEVTLTPHIGISVCNDGRCRAVDLVRDATIARAWARVQGAGSRVMFDPSMQPPADEPATSEFSAIQPATSGSGLFDRLDRLDERIASIEHRIAELGKINV